MNRHRILVAMSGGVDSSVAAALLVKQGHYVEGATMLFKGVLTDDVMSAREACAALGIKHRTFDFRKKYRDTVIRDFIDEYCRGRTPNPCVLCNERFKFGSFLQNALAHGFEAIATGHFAGVVRRKHGYSLVQGVDRNEQSYFLYRLGQKELARAVLPLARMTKVQVRNLARKIGLPTAQREKSQDICFLPDGDYASFLKKVLRIRLRPGPIVNEQGVVVGKHKGIMFYTHGQRKGLGISHYEPYYVTDINAGQNTITVGGRSKAYKQELIAGNLHFISGRKLTREMTVLAKARYFAALSAATIRMVCGRIKVRFIKPQWALTPGQSVVFYKNRTVLGGAIIDEIIA
ncbi:MAG TPA: tRNA 2-thiouridine(34) synthase MnmA [bacterium]